MSKKKKKKRVIVQTISKKDSGFDKKAFLKELEEQTRRVFYSMILPVEQRIDSLLDSFHNVKTNVVVTNTLLEKKKFFTREEFFAEFREYGKAEGGGEVDGSGQMDGNSVFSIYNYGG